MKNAKEILQFTGYPLEPIVALEVKKTLEAQLQENVRKQSPYVKMLGGNAAFDHQPWDYSWYSNYE